MTGCCMACEPLNLEWQIRSPGELAKAIRVAQDNLRDGTLLEVATGSSPSITTMAPDGPWEDYLHCEFRCSFCGALYLLAVETYHGSGGSWSPLRTT